MVRSVAAERIILLKIESNTLPFEKNKKMLFSGIIRILFLADQEIDM